MAPATVPPALVAVAFDDSVQIVHGPEHERLRQQRRVGRSAGTAVRTASALVGVTCLAGAAVLVLDPPTVDVGQVDLAPAAAADPDPAVAGTRPGTTAAPTSTTTTTAEADPAASTNLERGAVAGTGRAGPDRRVDPAPGAPSPARTPTATPTPAIDVGVSSGRVGDLPASAVAMPTRLRLPALDLEVPVVRVGQDDDGRMAVPEDIDDAGWYEFGPAPGEAGNAVVTGHVDSREQGLGAFHGLVDLAVGDRIVVDADDGTTSTWEVTGRALLDKSGLDTTSLFRRTGPAQLVLVTCGGNFDHAIRSYDSNLVVVATRTDS